MGYINDSPCHYCTPPKRNEWCHGTCKEYAKYRANLDAKAHKKRQEGAASVFLAEGSKERRRIYLKKLHAEKRVRHK